MEEEYEWIDEEDYEDEDVVLCCSPDRELNAGDDDLLPEVNTPDPCLGLLAAGPIKTLYSDDVECQIDAYVQYAKLKKRGKTTRGVV